MRSSIISFLEAVIEFPHDLIVIMNHAGITCFEEAVNIADLLTERGLVCKQWIDVKGQLRNSRPKSGNFQVVYKATWKGQNFEPSQKKLAELCHEFNPQVRIYTPAEEVVKCFLEKQEVGTRWTSGELADILIALGYIQCSRGKLVAILNALAAQKLGKHVWQNPDTGEVVMELGNMTDAHTTRLFETLPLNQIAAD